MNTAIAGRLMAAWERLWMMEAPANNLAAYRMIITGYLLWKIVSYDVFAFLSLPASFFTRYWQESPLTNVYVRLAFSGINLVGVPHEIYQYYWLGVVALLVAAFIGFKGRIACFLSAAALTPLLMMENISDGIGGIGHEVSIPLLLVLAASRCSDALSVDWWLKTRRWSNPNRSWEYGWPLRVGMFTLSMIYFYTGLTKVKGMGISYFILSDNMERVLMWASQYRPGIFPQVGGFLLDHPWMLRVLAAHTMTVELGFPIAFLFPRTKNFFLTSGLIFQTGIFLTFSLIFMDLMVYYSAYIDWQSFAASVRHGLFSGKHQRFVVYDGDCNFCRNSLNAYKTQDFGKRVTMVSSHDTATWQTLAPGVDPNRLTKEMLVIEPYRNVLYWGYDAWQRLMIIQPHLKPVGILMALPIIHPIGSLVYRWIADNRSRIADCDSGACRLEYRP